MSTIDTRQTHAFRQSPWQMILFALGAGAFVAAGVLMMTGVIALEGKRAVYQLAGAAGAAFFGLCLVFIIWRLLSMRGPVVTITPEGIRDTRIAASVIPWTAIERVSTWEAYKQKMVVVSVPPDIESRLGLTRMARWSRNANRSLGADGLCITSQGLPVGHDQLMKLILAYAEAARRE